MRQSFPQLVAGVCTLVAAAAIMGTYTVYSGTFDEPAHIAAGMELLDRGHYTYEPMHPPLARIAVALGPRLAGGRLYGNGTMWREGRNILYAEGRYVRNLSLARLGILPFFLLATLVVWMWTRRLAGDWGAAAAVALFVSTQPVLAHAGLATLDMAMAATCAAALFALGLWLDQPTRARGLALGASAGAAVVTKFSNGVFLPAAALAILGAWWLSRVPGPMAAGRYARSSVWAAGAGALVVWASYGFSFERVPAPEFWQGLGAVFARREIGWETYLWGHISNAGWWYFFPVALAVKTPLAMLKFAAAGAVAGSNAGRRADDWNGLAPLGAALAILVAGMFLAPGIGVRQILPIYPLIAITAGYGAMALWRLPRFGHLPRVPVVILLTWQLAGATRAYPDFLPWFNALGGEHPERIVLGGDLDWGQDLFRLVDTVEARQVDSLALAYFGSADPEMHFAHVRPLSPDERPRGWVAASVAVIKGLGVPGNRGFEWLDTIPPAAFVGKSIRLYRFPAQ